MSPETTGIVTASEGQYSAQVEYLGVVFTSAVKRNKKIDTPVGKSNAVLREQCRSVATKRKLSNTAMLSVF